MGSAQTQSEEQKFFLLKTALRQLLSPFQVETIFTIIFLYHHSMDLSMALTLHDLCTHVCTRSEDAVFWTQAKPP